MINTIKIIAVSVGVFLHTLVYAQSMETNPFGLVYKGAITQNMAGAVQIHSVNYSLNGNRIAANVYTPAGYDHSKKYAAIVIAHPNGGVKEQVSGLYAQHLAEKGYITIVADAAYQGASEGQPRAIDKPANRINDIHAMADFISKYPAVDIERIALLGICGGGGYALKAAQGDKRFKSIATLSMFNSGRVRRNGFLDKDVATIQERLAKASQARQREMLQGEISYLGTANPTDEEIKKIPTDLYREGYTYYYRTHVHPNATFKYTESSLIDLMTFDANTNMDLLVQPLLMIIGSKADTKYMSDEVFPKAINSTAKEMFILEGATHIETYWKADYVKQAVEKLTSFYGNTLK